MGGQNVWITRWRGGGGGECFKDNKKKWASNFNFMNLFEFPPCFLITPSRSTRGTRTVSAACWLSVALVDKWVYSHHQAWKCPAPFWWGVLLGLVFYEIPTMRCKSYIKGSWNMKKKKKEFAPVSSKCLGKEDATVNDFRGDCRTVPSGGHRSKKHTWMASHHCLHQYSYHYLACISVSTQWPEPLYPSFAIYWKI